MAGLAGHALTSGGFTAALTAFVVTGVVLVVLLFAAALGTAIAQQRVTARLEAGAATVKRWGGHVLIAVGVWLLLLAVFRRHVRGRVPCLADRMTGVWPSTLTCSAARRASNTPRWLFAASGGTGNASL